MIFLPIVERELRVAARSTATYRNRFIVTGLVALVVICMLGSVMIFDSGTSSSSLGSVMFWILAWIAFLFCLFEGMRKTADCLSKEKREGTLGLLFLTDLKGYDVVFGKLAAVSLHSIYGLIGIMPVLAIPLLMGGVTGGEFWRLSFALLNILFFSLCVGIWASSWNREERVSSASAWGVILFIAGVPLALTFLAHWPWPEPLSPAGAFLTASDTIYRGSKLVYWLSILFTQGMSWWLTISASRILPRSWRDRPMVTVTRRNRPQTKETADAKWQKRTKLLDLHPIAWLALRDARSTRFFLIGAFVLALANSIVLICLPKDEEYLPFFFLVAWAINFSIKANVASQSCHFLAQTRENNVLEMILVTPLKTQEIISGQIKALGKLFLVPVAFIIGIELLGIIIKSNSAFDQHEAISVIVFIFLLSYLVFFGVDIVAVIWAGMWFGLTSPNKSHATRKTIYLVLLLPYLSFVLSWIGFIFLLFSPMFINMWARQKINGELRTAAAQRFEPKREGGWLQNFILGKTA